MKPVLIATALALAAVAPASAADVSPPGAAAPAAPYLPTGVPLVSWTGIYIGANGGYSFGASNWTDSVTGGSSGNFETSGFVFGGTAGANYQIGAFVFGIEADGDWSDASGFGTFTAASFCAGGCGTWSNWLATVRGRAGYAFDRFLVFATAGGAFGDVEAGYSTHGASGTTKSGWTAGGGVEFSFAPNWTAKGEYLFVNLANGICTADCAVANANGPPLIPNIAVKFNESIVRAGVNYRFPFGW